MKRKYSAIIVMLLLLAMLTGCGPDAQPHEPNITESTLQQAPTTDLASDTSTEPSGTEPVPTEKENEVPVETEPTLPTETAPEESAQPTQPDPVEPTPTEPTAPVKPQPTTPAEPTEPEKPKPTDPPVTTVPPTEPAPSEPEVHHHVYTDKVVKPTCTKGGYAVHTCHCGDSYTDTPVAATGHSYEVISTKAPTLWAQGNMKYKCQSCADTYTEYTDCLSGEAEDQFLREVAEATITYINQFRCEQGDTVASALPGLTQVAEYRSEQLQTKFEHNTDALREACAYYQYGRWVDMSKYGYESYYDFDGTEAIGEGSWHGTADQMGYEIACAFRQSSGHWAYVGSSEYSYIGIGISYDASNYRAIKVCVLLSRADHG